MKLKTGLKVLITAGPTREYLDSVRFLSNASSGAMGLHLAQSFANVGAEVFVVCGPGVALPKSIDGAAVVSARDMLNAAQKKFPWCDVFVSVAAVADFRPAVTHTLKVKKENQTKILKLVRNPDILATLAKTKKKQFCVGFSLEDAANALEIARKKMIKKKCDLMVLNHASAMENSLNQLTILSPQGLIKNLPKQTKKSCAKKLCKIIQVQMKLNRS